MKGSETRRWPDSHRWADYMECVLLELSPSVDTTLVKGLPEEPGKSEGT